MKFFILFMTGIFSASASFDAHYQALLDSPKNPLSKFPSQLESRKYENNESIENQSKEPHFSDSHSSSHNFNTMKDKLQSFISKSKQKILDWQGEKLDTEKKSTFAKSIYRILKKILKENTKKIAEYRSQKGKVNVFESDLLLQQKKKEISKYFDFLIEMTLKESKNIKAKLEIAKHQKEEEIKANNAISSTSHQVHIRIKEFRMKSHKLLRKIEHELYRDHVKLEHEIKRERRKLHERIKRIK